MRETLSEAGLTATSNEILRGVVGSTAHGTAIEGQDDRDEMGIFVEPPEYVCGLRQLDHWVYRDKPTGVRSEPGDLDLTIYSLRKFCRLAVQGNPSVLVLLWLPQYEVLTLIGEELLAIKGAFHSQEAGQRFLGYLVSQKMAMTGQRSQKVIRTDLVQRYGYDVKFAMHSLRLGYEGIEFVSTGRITLPVPEPQLSALRAVRSGEVDLNEALELIEQAEEELRNHVHLCEAKADRASVNRFLFDAHKMHWQEKGTW